MNGPLVCYLLQPPPVVSQLGENNITGGGGDVSTALFKTLADVDPPGGGWSITQDGYLAAFIGATQHIHLISPASLAATLAPTIAGLININDLADVDTSGKATGSVLYWTGAVWGVHTFSIADFVSGSPSNGDEIRWSTSGSPHAEWFTPPTAPSTVFQGASQGYATYNNTSGNITSGSWSYTAANSTPKYVQLTGEASLGSGTEVTLTVNKNGSPIAHQTCAALGGSGSVNVTSPFVACASGDVFTLTTSAGTRQQFAIQVW